jgi:hypothetical protein
MADYAKQSVSPVPSEHNRVENSEQRPLPAAEYLGPADASEIVQVTIVLRRRPDGPPVPGFDHFTSPLRRRPRLSAVEFAAKYGADPNEIASVAEFARNNGLRIVETHAGRRTVVVSGTAAQMQAAFAVKLGRYRHRRVHRRGADPVAETYRGLDGFVSVPKALSPAIVGVFGLDNLPIRKRGMPADPNVTTPLTVQQITQCYNFPTNSAAGQTIAVFSGDTYNTNDITTSLGANAPTMIPVSVDHEINGGVSDYETTQDICIAASVAPGATIAIYTYPSSQVGYFDALQRVVHPNAGDPICHVLSTSYYISQADDVPTLQSEGFSVGYFNAIHQALEDAALQGVTFCVCSGDNGTDTTSYHGATSDNQAHVTFPASDPWALGCGGTTVGADSGAIGPQNFVEYVWNDNSGATGGGVSNFFPVPSYQNNVTIPLSRNTGQLGRGVPDVAGNAATASNYKFSSGGNPFIGGGTSAVAPLYAGLIAVINAALGEPVGFLNAILYTLGNSVCRDVNPWATNPPSGPIDNHRNAVTGYTAVAGWDACTGWGSINGQLLLNALQQGLVKDCYIVVDWGTFAKAGVAEMQAASPAGQAVFPNAFYVVVDGFTPADLGIGTANPVTPNISFSPQQPGGLTYKFGSPVPAGTPSTPNAPQRFTFACSFTFSDTSGFPAAPQVNQQIQINAAVTSATSTAMVMASAAIELTSQTSPFMVAGATSWLSDDIRVYQIQQNQSVPGVPSVVMPSDPSVLDIGVDAAYFLQQVLYNYNQQAATAPPNHPFDLLPTDEQTSILDTLQLSPANNPVFNFAFARVRYQDLATDAEGVRVFFRTFPALALSTAYDQTTTYRRWSDGAEFGHTIPLLGSEFSAQAGMQLETIPFFAQQRVNDTQVSMQTQLDLTNVQTIPHDATGKVTYAYYGCWLDTNQPEGLFPAMPTNDGPFSGALQSIATLFDNQHQCLTAEVAFDPIPIPQGATPGANVMLGQRNLAMGPVANPGHPASRRVSYTFEIKSPTTAARHGEPPDELMFDWGNTPAGATATLYIPAVPAAAILALAATIYDHHQITLVDAHTVTWPAAGVTYTPLPRFADGNPAAMLSVELPDGIKRGQRFDISVRQIVGTQETVDTRAAKASAIRWWKTLGAYQMIVPVKVKEEMLPSELRLLSVLRWMQEAKTKQSKWFAVFARYVDEIAARVAALGGNPALVKPSPYGDWRGGGSHPGPGSEVEYSGKVAGIKFDRFGEFDGFTLETEDGASHAFRSREAKVEVLVRRAWEERTTVVVGIAPHAPHWPAWIVLGRN